MTCFRGQHQAQLTAAFLTWERLPHTYLTELEPKLHCTCCRNRRDNSLAVGLVPRN